MFIAKEKGTENRVYIDDALSEKEYMCPNCHMDLIIKKDGVITPYFEHTTHRVCDTFTQDNSLWHKEWQNIFPHRNQEYYVSLSFTNSEYLAASKRWKFEPRVLDILYSINDDAPLKAIHRADVCACGYIILFQRNLISKEEFNEQNWFYTSSGKKVVWIFDISMTPDYETLINYDITEISKKWQWEKAPETFTNYLPQFRRKRKDKYNEWKDSSILLFFQTPQSNISDKGKIELVTWAIEKGNGESDFTRFSTGQKHVYTADEFRKAIVSRKL